jgi:ankyrin repeat protein
MKNRTMAGAALLAAVLTTAMAASAQETLVDLARSGQREAVLAAITSPDVDVNLPAADGSTALMWATYNVDHELVRGLLKAGARADVVNSFGSSALSEAVKLSDVELVTLLLDAGADADSPNLDNQTALMSMPWKPSADRMRSCGPLPTATPPSSSCCCATAPT